MYLVSHGQAPVDNGLKGGAVQLGLSGMTFLFRAPSISHAGRRNGSITESFSVRTGKMGDGHGPSGKQSNVQAAQALCWAGSHVYVLAS